MTEWQTVRTWAWARFFESCWQNHRNKWNETQKWLLQILFKHIWRKTNMVNFKNLQVGHWPKWHAMAACPSSALWQRSSMNSATNWMKFENVDFWLFPNMFEGDLSQWSSKLAGSVMDQRAHLAWSMRHAPALRRVGAWVQPHNGWNLKIFNENHCLMCLRERYYGDCQKCWVWPWTGEPPFHPLVLLCSSVARHNRSKWVRYFSFTTVSRMRYPA